MDMLIAVIRNPCRAPSCSWIEKRRDYYLLKLNFRSAHLGSEKTGVQWTVHTETYIGEGLGHRMPEISVAEGGEGDRRKMASNVPVSACMPLIFFVCLPCSAGWVECWLVGVQVGRMTLSNVDGVWQVDMLFTVNAEGIGNDALWYLPAAVHTQVSFIGQDELRCKCDIQTSW